MRINQIKPQFVLVMGGAGSGKNHFISKNHPSFKLVDVDEVKAELGISAAIGSIKPMLTNAFEQGIDVAHPTTGTNLEAQINKIRLAKKFGYTVSLVLIDTDPAKAIGQVRNRVQQGGHDVSLEKIVSSNKIARQNFDTISEIADTAQVVKN